MTCKEAVLVQHGDLGRDLCNRFAINASPFPDASNLDVWLHTPLWPGNDPSLSISYTQHADALRVYLQKADIHFRKLTHAFRIFKTRDLDEQGVEDAVRAGGRACGFGLAGQGSVCGRQLPRIDSPLCVLGSSGDMRRCCWPSPLRPKLP